MVWFWFLKKPRPQLPKSGLVPVWFILTGTDISDSNLPDQVPDQHYFELAHKGLCLVLWILSSFFENFRATAYYKKILMSIADLSFRAKLTFYLSSGVLNQLDCGSLEKATFYTLHWKTQVQNPEWTQHPPEHFIHGMTIMSQLWMNLNQELISGFNLVTDSVRSRSYIRVDG